MIRKRQSHVRIILTMYRMWAKNSTFNGYDKYFDAANPISGKGIQLQSPIPIYIYFSWQSTKALF